PFINHSMKPVVHVRNLVFNFSDPTPSPQTYSASWGSNVRAPLTAGYRLIHWGNSSVSTYTFLSGVNFVVNQATFGDYVQNSMINNNYNIYLKSSAAFKNDYNITLTSNLPAYGMNGNYSLTKTYQISNSPQY